MHARFAMLKDECMIKQNPQLHITKYSLWPVISSMDHGVNYIRVLFRFINSSQITLKINKYKQMFKTIDFGEKSNVSYQVTGFIGYCHVTTAV